MNKLLKIVEDTEGNISFIRCMGVVFAISFLMEWQKAIWCGGEGPGYEELATVLGTFGFKVLQKPFEKKKD